jgi:thiamine kinase-like enzyme
MNTIEDKFPKYIEKSSFVSKFENEDQETKYKFALYKDNSKLYFAKFYKLNLWIIDTYKLWIMNESNVYKILNEVVDSKSHKFLKYGISVPRLYKFLKNKSTYILLIEFIKGKSILKLSNNQKIKKFENISKFLSSIDREITKSDRSKLISRPAIYWIAVAFACLIPILIFYPKYIVNILKSFSIFCSSIFDMMLRKNIRLIHRDLNDFNLITKGGKSYLIDFQLTCLADPLLEYAVIYIKNFEDDDFKTKFIKNKYFGKQIFDPNNKAFKGYVISLSMYDLLLKNGQHDVSLNILSSM